MINSVFALGFESDKFNWSDLSPLSIEQKVFDQNAKENEFAKKTALLELKEKELNSKEQEIIKIRTERESLERRLEECQENKLAQTQQYQQQLQQQPAQPPAV